MREGRGNKIFDRFDRGVAGREKESKQLPVALVSLLRGTALDRFFSFVFYTLQFKMSSAVAATLPKSSKPGLEEGITSKDHRIRITLTSRHVKSLEAGKTPCPVRIVSPFNEQENTNNNDKEATRFLSFSLSPSLPLSLSYHSFTHTHKRVYTNGWSFFVSH